MKIINSDILSQKTGIIGHGVNCQGKMGSGIAKQIREKYPIVYKKYVDYVKNNVNLLGNVLYVPINNDLIIANCFTQKFYGYSGLKYADLSAIELCVDKLLKIKNKDIHLPKIGCGLGGLSWEDDVYPLLKKKNNERIFIYIL